MGFKPWWHDLHAICMGFKVLPLKTLANTSKYCNHNLKNPFKKQQQNKLDPSGKCKKLLKPTCLRTKDQRQQHRKHVDPSTREAQR